METSTLLLLAVAVLIPVVGFILTVSHSRGGETRGEQRWRRSHGLIFWVLAPGLTGLVTLLGLLDVLPTIFSMIGILGLALVTSISFLLQRRHEERG